MTNPEQTRSEEMQEKAEMLTLLCISELDKVNQAQGGFDTPDQAAEVISKTLNLPALLTAEAELRAIEDIDICRQQFPDGTVPTCTEACARGWKQWAEKFWAERDELRKKVDLLICAQGHDEGCREYLTEKLHLEKTVCERVCQERDQLRAELVESDRIIKADSRQINELGNQIEQLRAELATVKTESEKWKLGCETNADCYKTAVREQDNQRLELLKAKAENAALKLDIQRLNVKTAHLENALAAKEGK